MHLAIHTPDTASGPARDLLEGIRSELGFVPNMAGVVANSPALLAAFDGLRRAAGSTELDPVHREVAGLAFGVAANNAYGVAFHSTVLGQLGVADDQIELMRDGAEPDDPTLGAVYALAHAIATERGRVPDLTVRRTLDSGLAPTAILDVVAECAFASLVGVVDNLAGRVPLDEFLAPRAWA